MEPKPGRNEEADAHCPAHRRLAALGQRRRDRADRAGSRTRKRRPRSTRDPSGAVRDRALHDLSRDPSRGCAAAGRRPLPAFMPNPACKHRV